ncbi:hypothetical protein B0J14DRAFT_620962 [Halenospora varia]|nr:hypothetical protein B0J14DRAFT_620962 [Halenospora varia]
MEKTFQFVDSSAKVDRVTRKLMRSHVIKGKNAGKTVYRRSRLELGVGRTPCDDASFPDKEAKKRNSEGLGPVMYPSQLGLLYNGYKYDWLLTTFIDEDALYCSLALMASTNEFFIGGGISSLKALSYLSNTLSLVKRRMQGDKALSDSTLCMIHYEGLRKMIKLRGGLSQLESCPTLLLKMSKMDMLYTLRYRKPILFFRDRMSKAQRTLALMGLNFYFISISGEHQQDGINAYLQDILANAISITALFNNPPTGHTLDLSTFLEIDNRRIQEYDSISRRLREVLDDELDTHDGDLLLWLLFISSLWFSTKSGHWLLLRIRILTVRLNIYSWLRVRDSIRKFP